MASKKQIKAAENKKNAETDDIEALTNFWQQQVALVTLQAFAKWAI